MNMNENYNNEIDEVLLKTYKQRKVGEYKFLIGFSNSKKQMKIAELKVVLISLKYCCDTKVFSFD